MLEELLEAVDEDVLVLVTSDSGQSLGEHGVVRAVPPWWHDHRLHEEDVHLPLILAAPGCPAGRPVEALTASVDLARTTGAPLRAAGEGALHGHDLRPAALGEGHALREYVCLGHESCLDPQGLLSLPQDTRSDLAADDRRPTEWAIRTPDWYLRLPVHGDEG